MIVLYDGYNGTFCCPQTIDNEASYREKVTKTLKVESTISRGCVELLNPKQSLVRNGEQRPVGMLCVQAASVCVCVWIVRQG